MRVAPSARLSISRLRLSGIKQKWDAPVLEKRQKWAPPVVKLPTSSHRDRGGRSALRDPSQVSDLLEIPRTAWIATSNSS